MARLENNFSWSRSRDACYADCPRRYWFNYYGSFWGWERDAPPRTRKLYRLKQLKSRWMWAGELVHGALEATLKTQRAGGHIEPAGVEQETVARMRADYRRSLNREYRTRPKACALFEHYYEEALPDAGWVEVRDHVQACLARYFESPFPDELATLPADAWLSVEDISTFDFEGTKVWVVPDLAYRRADGDVVIVDWKTGRAKGEPDPVQLACYALFATQSGWGTPSQVLTIEYNLHRGEAQPARVALERLDAVRQRMRESIGAMRALLADPERNVAQEDDFPMTTSAGTCARCNYKEECHGEGWRQLSAAPAASDDARVASSDPNGPNGS